MKHINPYTTLFSITQHIFSQNTHNDIFIIYPFLFLSFSYSRMPPIPPFLAFLRFPLFTTPHCFFLHISLFLLVPTPEPHFPLVFAPRFFFAPSPFSLFLSPHPTTFLSSASTFSHPYPSRYYPHQFSFDPAAVFSLFFMLLIAGGRTYRAITDIPVGWMQSNRANKDKEAH